MRLCVDSAVFIRAFLKHQDGHAESRRFVDRIFSGEIVADCPYLVLVEVVGAITREEGADRARRVLQRLYPLVRFAVSDIEAYWAAVGLIQKVALSGADTMIATHAFRAGIPLVTTDGPLLKRAAAVLRTYRPEEVP